MDFRLRTFALAFIAIAALGLVSSATAEKGEKGENGRHAANAKNNRHCVTDLSKPDTPPTCYDTFTAAIAAATGGQITDAPADSRVAMNDQRLLARMNATDGKKSPALNASGDKKSAAITPTAHVSGHIGTIFYDDGFRGSSLNYIGSHGCDDDVHENPFDAEFRKAYVGDDWNDDFESIKGFNNCGMKVWEHRDFRGVTTNGFFFSLSDLGVLNDEGSSLAFD